MKKITRTETTQSQLVDFVKTIKEGLKLGLGSISLLLVDLELYHSEDKLVLDPELEAWCLRCVVTNPMTKQAKESRTNFQARIGDTSVEDVKDMVVGIVDKFRMAFYGE